MLTARAVPGGTGEISDRAAIPHNINAPLVLAFRLTPSNIAKLVRGIPYGVDASGGVEATHVIKDLALLSDFIMRKQNSPDRPFG
ncbi:MAG: hypothetical protein U5M23_16295 [Marinagarivorans sp.]|nr:hypothetical protein [Marinagarivorans sp.]